MMQHSPHIKKSWGLVLATVPWDQLGQRLYDTIFEVRARSSMLLTADHAECTRRRGGLLRREPQGGKGGEDS